MERGDIKKKSEDRIKKRYIETFENEQYVHYLKFNNGFSGLHIYKLHTLKNI